MFKPIGIFLGVFNEDALEQMGIDLFECEERGEGIELGAVGCAVDAGELRGKCGDALGIGQVGFVGSGSSNFWRHAGECIERGRQPARQFLYQLFHVSQKIVRSIRAV